MFYVIIYVLLCYAVGTFGTERKIGFWASFGFSLFLSPVIGAIITAMSKSLADEKREIERDKINAAMAEKIVGANKPSITEQIASLNELKSSGAITEEEFASLKAKIISGN